MITVQIIAELMAAGLAGDGLLEALKRIETAEIVRQSYDSAHERKRAWDREYQANRRKIVRQSSESHDFYGKKEIPPIPPKETLSPLSQEPLIQKSQKDQKEVVARGKCGQRLPATFELTDEMLRWAWAEERMEGDRCRRETANFIDHWQSSSGANARKRDWLAAWRKWMRKASDDGRNRKEHPQVQRNGIHEAARANLDRVRRGENGDPMSEVFGRTGSTGGDVPPRLLPRLRES